MDAQELKVIISKHRFVIGYPKSVKQYIICTCGHWIKPAIATLNLAVNQYELHLATEIIKRIK